MKMLKGKTAVITGGGSGMGRAIAMRFLIEGANVFLLGRTEKKLIETIKLLEEVKGNIDYSVCDVSNKLQVKNSFQYILEQGTNFDIIVNCAGVINVKKANGDMDHDAVMDINFKGILNVCEIAVEYLCDFNKSASIINISSISGHNGSVGFPSYAASKGAVLAYTKSLAMKYGKNGIRVNSISPGVVVTPMSYIERPNYDECIPRLVKKHPLGRLGKPEDIADAALFFGSSMSDWITGQDLIVDGGYTLQQ